MGRRVVVLSVIVWLGVALPALAQGGSGGSACSGLSGAAFGLCNAFCEAQNCDVDSSKPSCAVLRQNFQRQTGSSVFPCEVAVTPTDTPSAVATDTPTAAATSTATAVFTATATTESTATETPEPTATDTALPTATNTTEPTFTAIATNTATTEATATETPVATATDTTEPTFTAIATNTATTEITATETPEATATDTAEPTATDTEQPADTETPTPTETSTPTFTVTTSTPEGLAEEAAVSLNASSLSFVARLTGDEEVPPVATEARGRVKLRLSAEEDEIRFKLNVAKITGVTQAHIHCGPAGVNGSVTAFLFPFTPTGVDANGRLASGTITDADVLPLPDSAACPGGISNLADLIAKMRSGQTYVNVHTLGNPSGEIRGQL